MFSVQTSIDEIQATFSFDETRFGTLEIGRWSLLMYCEALLQFSRDLHDELQHIDPRTFGYRSSDLTDCPTGFITERFVCGPRHECLMKTAAMLQNGIGGPTTFESLTHKEKYPW